MIKLLIYFISVIPYIYLQTKLNQNFDMMFDRLALLYLKFFLSYYFC